MDKDTTQNVNAPWNDVNGYHLFSSVTGQKISDLDYNGDLLKTYVYMGASVIAEKGPNLTDFKFTDPITGSTRTTDSDGVIFTNEEDLIELGGLGTSVPTETPSSFPDPGYTQGGSPGNPENGCEVDGVPVTCTIAAYWAAMDDKMKDIFDKGREKDGSMQASVGNGQNSGDTLPDFPDDIVFADGAEHGHTGLKKYRYEELLPGEGGWTTVEGWGRDPMSDNPCAKMAVFAGRLVTNLIKEQVRSGSDGKVDFFKALRDFDNAFSEHYVGASFESSSPVEIYLGKTPGATATENEKGQRDFRPEFHDIIAFDSEDQTHHFAAFLSVGINLSLENDFFSTIHEGDDRWQNNAGDVNLGRAAYNYGVALHRDPGGTLGGIEAWIRKNICIP